MTLGGRAKHFVSMERVPQYLFLMVDAILHCSALFLARLFAGKDTTFSEYKVLSLYRLKQMSVSVRAEALESPENYRSQQGMVVYLLRWNLM